MFLSARFLPPPEAESLRYGSIKSTLKMVRSDKLELLWLSCLSFCRAVIHYVDRGAGVASPAARRRTPSLRMRERNVLGCNPKMSAAPFGPSIRQFV
jgi:hypothetical protein